MGEQQQRTRFRKDRLGFAKGVYHSIIDCCATVAVQAHHWLLLIDGAHDKRVDVAPTITDQKWYILYCPAAAFVLKTGAPCIASRDACEAP